MAACGRLWLPVAACSAIRNEVFARAIPELGARSIVTVAVCTSCYRRLQTLSLINLFKSFKEGVRVCVLCPLALASLSKCTKLKKVPGDATMMPRAYSTGTAFAATGVFLFAR